MAIFSNLIPAYRRDRHNDTSRRDDSSKHGHGHDRSHGGRHGDRHGHSNGHGRGHR